jgi:hypothetical protein
MLSFLNAIMELSQLELTKIGVLLVLVEVEVVAGIFLHPLDFLMPGDLELKVFVRSVLKTENMDSSFHCVPSVIFPLVESKIDLNKLIFVMNSSHIIKSL